MESRVHPSTANVGLTVCKLGHSPFFEDQEECYYDKCCRND